MVEADSKPVTIKRVRAVTLKKWLGVTQIIQREKRGGEGVMTLQNLVRDPMYSHSRDSTKKRKKEFRVWGAGRGLGQNLLRSPPLPLPFPSF